MDKIVFTFINFCLTKTILFINNATTHGVFFSVKKLYEVVELRIFGEVAWRIPNHIRKVVPLKIVLLLWHILRNRVAVKVSLQQRGVLLEDGVFCILCGYALESVSHLFLECMAVWRLWTAVLSREGVLWCAPRCVADLLREWASLLAVSDSLLWDLIPYALCWSVWLARNDCVFQNAVFNFETVWDLHLMRIFWWIQAFSKECSYTANAFLYHFERVRLNHKVKPTRICVWSPPPADALKFNVDGSAKGSPGPSGIGGVCRNHKGEILGFFSKLLVFYGLTKLR